MSASLILDIRFLLHSAQATLNQVDGVLAEMERLEGGIAALSPDFAPYPDPRAPSAARHSVDSTGLVDGVWLAVHPTPGALYRCTNVYVIGEGSAPDRAQGKAIAYVSVGDRNGQRATPRVVLATGYQGVPAGFDSLLDVKFDKDPIEIPIGSAFSPPNLGPLAIFVADETGHPISDVVASLGLPGGRPLGFSMSFVEVAA